MKEQKKRVRKRPWSSKQRQHRPADPKKIAAWLKFYEQSKAK